VKIDLHHHLLQNRRHAAKAKPVWWERAAFAGFAFLANTPTLYRTLLPLARLGMIFHPIARALHLDPAYTWTNSRELPPMREKSFREQWSSRKQS
jgi:L-lactate dehydrogenase complex protein LldF